MPTTKSRLITAIDADTLQILAERAPRIAGGRAYYQPLRRILSVYDAHCKAALARVFAALPDKLDQQFMHHVLCGLAEDELTLSEMPLTLFSEIAEATEEYEGEEGKPYTAALLPTLKRFGAWEAIALADWIDRERIRRDDEQIAQKGRRKR